MRFENIFMALICVEVLLWKPRFCVEARPFMAGESFVWKPRPFMAGERPIARLTF